MDASARAAENARRLVRKSVAENARKRVSFAQAVDQARAAGIDANGPFGADTMYLDKSFDAYVVMYHDQGHIPAKLVGFDGTAAFAIGTPVLFSSVAHGSALDIAGRGKASAGALVWAIKQISGAAAAA